MNDDLYKAQHRAGSKLKMKAKSLLLDWDPEDSDYLDYAFEAAVLFHQAERLELQAIRSLVGATDETRLNAAVERCACLVEGLDPPGAAQVWGEVLELAERLPVQRRAAYTEDFYVRLQGSLDAWNEAYAPLRHLLTSDRFMPTEPVLRAQMRTPIEELSRKFPGVAHLWWRIYRHQEAEGDLRSALETLRTRAQPLDPWNLNYLGATLDLLIRLDEPPSVLDETLEQIDLQVAQVPVCILYASAEIRLARQQASSSVARLARARRAIFYGLRQPTTKALYHQHLRALELFVEALEAEGSVDVRGVLFRAGLGDFLAEDPTLADQAVEEVVARLAREFHEDFRSPPRSGLAA